MADGEQIWRVMSRLNVAAAVIAALSVLLLPNTGRAESARSALVMGNGTYAALPGIPGCARSANAVAAALRGAGFNVTERQDASTGGLDAGISEFSQHLAEGKGAAFIYVCAYATDFNNRTFLLPTTARIARPTDALTQGVMAKSMLATVSRDPATVGVVVFDLVPSPEGPPRIDVDALGALAVPEGIGIIAVTETTLGDSPTPLAAALVTGLKDPVVRTDTLLANIRARLTDAKVGTVAFHAPVQPAMLVGSAPPPEPPRPVAAPVSAPTSSPVAVVPATIMPDEAQMTEVDRRKVQGALVRLGYYAHAIDGQFGAETRAAIRRFQHEIGGEVTGRLTGAQASRLVDSR